MSASGKAGISIPLSPPQFSGDAFPASRLELLRSASAAQFLKSAGSHAPPLHLRQL